MRASFFIRISIIIAFQLWFAVVCKGQNISTEKIVLGLVNESLETALKKIEQNSSFHFFYRESDVKPFTSLTMKPESRTIEQTLLALLQNTNFTFRQIDNNILLELKSKTISRQIKGQVLNNVDKKPIANASVFLSNATVGCTTRNDGAFVLSNVAPGNYIMVVSMVGFEPFNQAIVVANDNIVLSNIIIDPKPIVLNEVKVSAKEDPDRERNFGLFKEQFLGTSDLAGDCKILNPEVLDLSFDDSMNTLTATSIDFLIIDNEALGYRLKYLLKNFRIDFRESSSGGYYHFGHLISTPNGALLQPVMIHYEGSVFFEELKGTKSQLQRWHKQREKTYLGSEMHFFRSVIQNQIEEEGFRVLKLGAKPGSSKEKSTKFLQALVHFPLKAEEFIKLTDRPGIYAISCANESLLISYSKNHHFSKSEKLNHLFDTDNTGSTVLNFNNPFVFFDRNGSLIDPNNVTFNGAWGRNRVAELLPVDYQPIQNNNSNTGSGPIFLGNILANLQASLTDSLLKITAAADSNIKNHPAESIYLQTDKPNYSTADTIWFKAWLFNAPSFGLSAKSGIMYVDVYNDSTTFVQKYRIPVKEGLAWGNISLNDLPAGNYTIRAYTNWMRNFNTDGFFYKHFWIADNKLQTWLAKGQTNTSDLNNEFRANVKMQLSDMDKKPIANKKVNVAIGAKNRHLYKQQLQTDKNGELDVNFIVPEKAQGITVAAVDEETGKSVVLPINLNRPQDADVQFLPEGGDLVAGLRTHIGFKAVGEDGKGITVSGVVSDHGQNQVASFTSLNRGMGSFDLMVKQGETYTAKVNLPGGNIREYSLPAVKTSGIVLNVLNPLHSDSVSLLLSATNDLKTTGEVFYLLAKSRGVICYAALLNFRDGDIRHNISKKLFPSGITHFVLMNTKKQPLNERLVFIDHHDNLKVDLAGNKILYTPHDSVSVQVTVRDSTGSAVAGNFAVAVTDDAQVKQDTLNAENILTRMLLSAQLKGYVEQPGYYLQTGNTQVWQALDNLLLTQGWVNYEWSTDKQQTIFTAENEFAVKGQVKNAFNQSVKGTKVALLSKSPLFARDTITDKEGRFIFKHLPKIDTPSFVINAVNRNGNSFNVDIRMDDPTPPMLVNNTGPMLQPWYLNTDTVILNSAKNNRTRIEQPYTANGGHLLNEVKITAKKIVKDSHNLNGAGEADLVLDDKDMVKAGKKTLLDLFTEKIKGFRTGRSNYYFIEDEPVLFVIDGQLLNRKLALVYQPQSFADYIEEITDYLTSHNAEDVLGIEVNASSKYNTNYRRQFTPLSQINFTFIEVTTRSGRGPDLMPPTPGTFLYKPLPISKPAQFYKPKYLLNDTTKHLPDFRSTIDWEPNITTDKNGKATISFYAADKRGTYTLIIEGTDGNGNLGYKTYKIKVNQPKQGTK